MLNERWRLTVLGDLRAEQCRHTITRFRTHAAGELLAYLALHPERAHPRDDIQELLWPGEDMDVGRNRLRVALSSLRRQFEPPDISAGSVIVSTRTSVRLNAAAFTTDVADFEHSLAVARSATEDYERAGHLYTAVSFYHGVLLPTYGAEWVEAERERLARGYVGALRGLTRHLALARDFDRALDYAKRAVAADPWREELHRDLLRLYMAAGRRTSALRHVAALQILFRDQVGAPLSDATRRIVEPGADRGWVASSDHAPSQSHPEPQLTADHHTKAFSMHAVSNSAAPDSHLPPEVTGLFGRETELAKLEEMLQADAGMQDGESDSQHSSFHLVTLTGTGGIGKTRLAIAAARRLCESFPGGTWFLSLADVTDPALFVRALQVRFGLLAQVDREPLEQVAEFLGNRGPALLLLDNFEQLVDDGATVVTALMQRVPEATILVTSRRSLGLQGEREFHVTPLEIPCVRDGPRQLLAVASVRLLVDRAQAVRPDFQVTARNAPAVAELCRRLEGIPLALELAAARVRVLTPAQMLNSLACRADLLVNPHADTQSRHRSLRATIDWSYQLLPSGLQHFFARLSVFQGGWDAEAAAAVCQEPMALACIEQLHSSSLIVAVEQGDAMRFRMLESLRGFARYQLTQEDFASARWLHAQYFTALAEEVRSNNKLERNALSLNRMESEHDNFRGVLAWAAETGRSDIGLRLATAAHEYWQIRGHHGEGLEWITLFLNSSQDAQTSVVAPALVAAGNLACCQYEYARAGAFFQKSLALFRNTGDKRGIASAQNGLAIVAYYSNEYLAAQSYWGESLALWRELQDGCKVANALNNLAGLEQALGHYDTALGLGAESLAIWRKERDLLGSSYALGQLGTVLADRGCYSRAEELFQESLTILRSFGHKWRTFGTILELTNVCQLQGRHEDAFAWLAASAHIGTELDSPAAHCQALCGFGRHALTTQKLDLAATLFGAAEALCYTSGATFTPVPLSRSYVSLRGPFAALAGPEYSVKWAAGRAMSFEQALQYALGG